ncbi:GNAT family N-acetyltransferase [Actinoplanes sp. CA-015351]|uniref:GNAT family N-acetyltransferase n=1 Tax=Actinoplanes sp. CA-015351 TaxID=3239897 RepID=UPI003D96DCF0
MRFVKLSPAALQALIAGDLDAASAEAGFRLSQYLADERWLWEIRLADIEKNPQNAEWIARAAVATDNDEEIVVGHGGFHGPPDEDGVVEVAYSVDPAYRRRGHARAMLTELLARVDADERVSGVRASIRPDNAGSKATIAGFGFFKIGEQWDPEDGLEDVYLRSNRTTSGR